MLVVPPPTLWVFLTPPVARYVVDYESTPVEELIIRLRHELS